MRARGKFLLALVTVSLPALLWAQPQRFITIGTGGVTGVYYGVGGALCQLVNKNRRVHGLRCSVEATSASVFNLQAVRRGDLDFGIAESGGQFDAWHGADVFRREGADRKLRSILSLHSEVLTLVARHDIDVRRFHDLRGRRLNIGVVGAGTRVAAERLIAAMGMTPDDFAELAALKPDEQGRALCEQRIDAFVYMIGHPADNIREVTERCDAKLVPLAGPEIDRLVRDNPYYVSATIPGGTYRGNPQAIVTYGVRATLVTSTETSADVVYQLVKSVFDNLSDFVALHPALVGLDPQSMTSAGLAAPLHEGALRYYRERGWRQGTGTIATPRGFRGIVER